MRSARRNAVTRLMAVVLASVPVLGPLASKAQAFPVATDPSAPGWPWFPPILPFPPLPLPDPTEPVNPDEPSEPPTEPDPDPDTGW